MHRYIYRSERVPQQRRTQIEALFFFEYVRLDCVSLVSLFGLTVYTRIGNKRRFLKRLRDYA